MTGLLARTDTTWDIISLSKNRTISVEDKFSTAGLPWNGQNYKQNTFSRSTIQRSTFQERYGRVLSLGKYGVNDNWDGSNVTRRSTDTVRRFETKLVAVEPQKYIPEKTLWNQAIATKSFSMISNIILQNQPTKSWTGSVCTNPSSATVTKKLID